MRLYRTLALLASVLLWPAIATPDIGPIDRTLRRQPAYAAKPHYCLLLFGPEGKTRVWLVAAGEAFYADTNGDDDLTQPGKRVYSVGNYRSLVLLDPCTRFMWFPVPEHVRVYNVGDVFDRATRTWYHLTVHRLGKLETAVFRIVVDVRGQSRQLGELSRFGDHPKDAPVLHFSGPLTLGLFTSQLTRGGGPNDIGAWIGTKAPGGTEGEPTYLVLDDWIPPGLSPVALVEFPKGTPGAGPIRSAVRLARREGLVRFSGRIAVPGEAGQGKAKIRLTLPGWQGGVVQPSAVEIPLVEPRKSGAPHAGAEGQEPSPEREGAADRCRPLTSRRVHAVGGLAIRAERSAQSE
jgi:hypothetical protein